MKYAFWMFLWICAASVASVGTNVQAARSQPLPRTAILAGPDQLVLICPADAYPGMSHMEPFSDALVSEPEPDSTAGDRDDDRQAFACFSASAIETWPGRAARQHWLESMRLVPAFPQVDSVFFCRSDGNGWRLNDSAKWPGRHKGLMSPQKF